jgi:tetratricopeptide (TPR) repeat protein
LSAEIKSTAQQEKVALSNEAAIALRQRNDKLAVEKQEAVLKIDRDDSAARRNLATALNCVAMEETTSPTEAINCFHKALFWSPYNSTSLIHLNECIRQSGKNPDDFTTRSNLGDKARKQADFMGAIVEYQQALKIKDDPKIRERLGDVFMLRDQTHEALAEYLGGWRIKPTASLAVKIGQTYQASGDIHNAILFYDEARELPEESTDEAVEAGWERALKEGRSRPAVNQENE